MCVCYVTHLYQLMIDVPVSVLICRWWQVPYFWAGLKVYDLISGRQLLKPSYLLSKKTALEEFPMLKRDKLCGAIVYYDGEELQCFTTVTSSGCKSTLLVWCLFPFSPLLLFSLPSLMSAFFCWPLSSLLPFLFSCTFSFSLLPFSVLPHLCHHHTLHPWSVPLSLSSSSSLPSPSFSLPLPFLPSSSLPLPPPPLRSPSPLFPSPPPPLPSPSPYRPA